MTATLSSAYRSLFPAAVAAAEMRRPGDPACLYPAESAHVARAVPKRVQEFAAGRLCARRALAEFGIVDFAVRVAADRQPIWPDTMVGSITHTDGLCAAVVAQRRQLLGIGVDSEVVAPVSGALFGRICVPAECDWVASLPASQQAAATMLIFSVKEAFYKCQFPIVGEWLDFKDLYVEAGDWTPPAEPRLEPPGLPAGFRVRPTRPIALAHRASMPVHGHYRFHEQFVSAGIALAA